MWGQSTLSALQSFSLLAMIRRIAAEGAAETSRRANKLIVSVVLVPSFDDDGCGSKPTPSLCIVCALMELDVGL